MPRNTVKKPVRPRRKFVLVEVETTLSNATLAALVREELHATHIELGGDVVVLQVHVNAAKRGSHATTP